MEHIPLPSPRLVTEWTCPASGTVTAIPRRATRDVEMLHLARHLGVPQALLRRLPDLPGGSPAYEVATELEYFPGIFECNSPLWKRHCGFCGDLCVHPSPSHMKTCRECGLDCCDQCCICIASTDEHWCVYCLKGTYPKKLTNRMAFVDILIAEFKATHGEPSAAYETVVMKSFGFPYEFPDNY